MTPSFQRELAALVEKHKVHEAVGLTLDLTVSSICTQLDYFARTPKGCHNHAPIKTEKGNH